MTANTRSPERIERARDRAAARETLLVLLGRVDRLSPAEAALLREYTLAVLTEADEQAHSRRGLDRARDRLQRSLTAAERAIVEVEAERDQARSLAARHHAAWRAARRRAQVYDTLISTSDVQAEAQRRRGDSWRGHCIAQDERADRNHAAWRSARRRARRATLLIQEQAKQAATDRHHRDRIEQRLMAATGTLRSIRNARTMGDIWAQLGMYFGLTAEQAGQEARDRRTVAERIADDRAGKATAVLSEQATKVAQLRQQVAEERKRAGALVLTLARERKAAGKDAQRVDTFRRRARTAEATIAAIRTPQPVGSGHPMYALLDAMIGPRIGQVEARELLGDYFRAITQQEPTP
ncbi:hypothetical protein ABZT27_34395 [Streptomyces sp. NPDC005389]|uniref:hypothetical protein n=1 Tax=Streptomyces sp. NPDC005389 TaxID=3157040 RepID=UPI0033AD3727